MTKQELLDMAKYVVLPKGKEYSIPNALRLGEGEQYKGWSLNEHHYTTRYHRECLFPALESLLNFKVDKSSFDVKEAFVGQFDISNWYPKSDDYLFDTYCINDDSKEHNATFETIVTNPYKTSDITEYHRLYRYGHKCSQVVNLRGGNGRTIMISGDSQMIPSIPILCTVFKELWYIDNRSKIDIWSHIKDVEFTDVLVVMHWNPQQFYLDTNFKGA